jgi:hypothetical protein
MTPTQAEQIWQACYGDTDGNGWALYTSEQRLLAIEVRQQEHDRQHGCWGTWNVSDRH